MSRRSAQCDCGSPKRVGAEACDRCTALDGANVTESTLINALRNLGGNATNEATLLETGWSFSQLRRAARRLEASGRVARGEVENANPHTGGVASVLLQLDSARPSGWRQLPLPRVSEYLEPVEVAAGSGRIMRIRRVARRAHRLRQLGFKFRKSRRAPSEPERVAA